MKYKDGGSREYLNRVWQDGKRGRNEVGADESLDENGQSSLFDKNEKRSEIKIIEKIKIVVVPIIIIIIFQN